MSVVLCRSLFAALVLAWAGPVLSQAQASASPASVSPQPVAWTEGEVKKVDLAAGKVTIKHGEIKHLDMPGMTMVFTAREPGLLDGAKPGDKIQFRVVNEGGKMVVTEIRPQP